MPVTFNRLAAETSFVAYLHYLLDLDGVVGGRYGRGVAGVYQTMRLHPPARVLPERALSPADTATVAEHLHTAWTRLAAAANAADAEQYDRQANAVVPVLAVEAVVSAARALAVALDGGDLATGQDALSFLGDLTLEELFPYPWSAHCIGCPQLGTAEWGGSVLPGATVSVFSFPDPSTSDARLAVLLRTTRQRVLERHFAVERQTDVRPGRTRRNLSADDKQLLAETVAPTTVFDVLDRVARRVEEDDGEAFVTGPLDEAEAQMFAAALAAVADATVAVVEAVVAAVIGWDVFADLVAAGARRHPAPPLLGRRAAV